jgi:hypothetical protein
VPPPRAAAPAPLAARPSVRTSAADEPGPSAWRGRAIWVTGAAAGIALASGGVLQWIGSRRADAFNHTVAPNPATKCDRILPDHGGGECRSLSGAFDRYRRLALFGYGAGGALAAGAALLYLTRPAEPPVGARRTLACAAVPPGGVGCVVGF